MQLQDAFLKAARHIVFYGLKRNGKGFAYDVLRGVQQFRSELKITPVHLHMTSLAGLECAISAQVAQPAPDSAMVVLNAVDTPKALDDVASAGIRRVWLVQNSATQQNITYARSRGIDTVSGCPLLFIPGLGFPHNFHRGLARLFGRI